jgi:hypothetical protein
MVDTINKKGILPMSSTIVVVGKKLPLSAQDCGTPPPSLVGVDITLALDHIESYDDLSCHPCGGFQRYRVAQIPEKTQCEITLAPARLGRTEGPASSPAPRTLAELSREGQLIVGLPYAQVAAERIA